MSERITCPRCGGKLGVKKADVRGDFKRCLECGYKYRLEK